MMASATSPKRRPTSRGSFKNQNIEHNPESTSNIFCPWKYMSKYYTFFTYFSSLYKYVSLTKCLYILRVIEMVSRSRFSRQNSVRSCLENSRCKDSTIDLKFLVSALLSFSRKCWSFQDNRCNCNGWWFLNLKLLNNLWRRPMLTISFVSLARLWLALSRLVSLLPCMLDSIDINISLIFLLKDRSAMTSLSSSHLE